MLAVAPQLVEGHVARGFEAVREEFAENFASRGEFGGACCVYHRGEKVDLWGGIRNKQTGALWERDTMVVVHSATKGLAAMTLALAHSRGWLDYEARVSTYWPEFAQNGNLLAAPAVAPAHGFYDECLKGEVQFSLGFMKPCENWRFGSPRSFGSPGTGGALGFADPDAGVGYAYVTSRMGMVFTGDPRDVALREALYSALVTS